MHKTTKLEVVITSTRKRDPLVCQYITCVPERGRSIELQERERESSKRRLQERIERDSTETSAHPQHIHLVYGDFNGEQQTAVTFQKIYCLKKSADVPLHPYPLPPLSPKPLPEVGQLSRSIVSRLGVFSSFGK